MEKRQSLFVDNLSTVESFTRNSCCRDAHFTTLSNWLDFNWKL